MGRRPALVVGALVQALGFAAWTATPGLPAFAAGFVLWGLGGALASGAQEALLHDGLAAVGAADEYARVQGRVAAVGLLAQLPAAGAATVLFAVGGYPAVGWASVGACLGAALVAARLPEPPRTGADPDGDADGSGYLATLRAGVAEAVVRPGVRGAALAFGLLFGLDTVEEYFPLIARDLGIGTASVPVALLAIPLAGALGAAAGGRTSRLGPVALAGVLLAGAGAFAAAAAADRPAALLGMALFYGLYRAVLVVTDARLQERITGPARATVTSVANVAAEVPAFAVYVAWVLGGTTALTVLVAATALVLPVLLGRGR
jgi:hypothetical protein